MLALDLLAARAAGLAGLDRISWSAEGLVVGVTLFALGTGVALWSRRTPSARLIGPEAVSVAAAALATASGGRCPVTWPSAPRSRSRRSVPSPGSCGPGCPWSAGPWSCLSAVSWAALVLDGLVRAVDDDLTLAGWWSQLRGWPLLVAAAYAGLRPSLPRLPLAVRATLAGLALACVAVLASAPRRAVRRPARRGPRPVAGRARGRGGVAPRPGRSGPPPPGSSGPGRRLRWPRPRGPCSAGLPDGVAPAPWAWVGSGLAVGALAAAAPRVAPAPRPPWRARSPSRWCRRSLLGVAAAVATTTGCRAGATWASAWRPPSRRGDGLVEALERGRGTVGGVPAGSSRCSRSRSPAPRTG